MISIKTKKDLDLLKVAGRRLALLLDDLLLRAVPGVSTFELDAYAYEYIKKHGDSPSLLNYLPDGAVHPYPSSLCISINDEVVHGIPSKDRILQEGDIVTIDGCLTHGHMVADAARTKIVGVSDNAVAHALIAVAQEAFIRGCAEARSGKRVGDISAAIGSYIKSQGFSVADGLAGHGVGYGVHEDPYVPNVGIRGRGELLKPGMTLAIEPIITAGKGAIELLSDGYTYITKDGSLAAHYENTVIITEHDPVVVTMIS